MTTKLIHYASLFSHYTPCGITISSYAGIFRQDVEETSKLDEVTCAKCRYQLQWVAEI